MIPTYKLTDLGIPPGYVASYAIGLNDRGQVIGSLRREEIDDGLSGFLWTVGQMRDLRSFVPHTINNRGEAAGAKHPKWLQRYAALYTAGRVQELLKNTSASSAAKSLNDSGQIVGHAQSTHWRSVSEIKRGCFVWKNGKRRYLDIPDGFHAGEAACINDLGVIVGHVWRDHPNDEHPIFWESETVQLLPHPAGFNQARAIAVNIHGQILVRAQQSNFHDLFMQAAEGIDITWECGVEANQEGWEEFNQRIAAVPPAAWRFYQQSFLWDNGYGEPIDMLATGLNDHGQVVGWTGCGTSDPTGALLWQDGELRDLNSLLKLDSQFELKRANAINNHGQIVGHGKLHGITHAFLLTPIEFQ